MSDKTILARWASEGEQQFESALQRVQQQMSAAASVAIELGAAFNKKDKEVESAIKRIEGLTNITREYARTVKELNRLHTDEPGLRQMQNQSLTQRGGFNWISGEQGNKSAKDSAAAFQAAFKQIDNAAKQAKSGIDGLKNSADQLNATPLGRFQVHMAGSVEGLKQFEANTYNASRMSALFSQQLVTNPIQTLKSFTASTEKAAIAAQYFKEQLAFIAASRFGTILIWGSVIAGIGATMKAVTDASIEMDSAIHRVASAFIDEGNAAIKYDEIQRRLAISSVSFGKSFKDSAEVMWELKSAGLSVTETYAAMDPAMKLVLAGAENINQSTRLLAGLYKQFGSEIKGARTEQERFAGVAGTIAYANIKSQATIDTLMQSYKYAAGVAKATGVSFNELTAAIAVANNAMLFGSTAGTGLAQELLEVAKNYKKIGAELGIALDPTKPLQFTEFLHQMAENSELVTKRLDAMAEVSGTFNVRALRALLAQIDAIKEYDKILAGLNSGAMAEYLDKISDQRLASFENQWKRLKATLSSTVEMSTAASWFGKLLKYTNDEDEAIRRLTSANIALGNSWLYARMITAKQLEDLKLHSSGMDEVLKKAKELEQRGYKKAAESGSVEAAVKLADSRKETPLPVEKFKDLLSEEQRYRYELLLNNKTLEEQILRVKERMELAQQTALDARNTNKDQKEATEEAEKALRFHEQLNGLLERQKQAQEKIRQDEERQRTTLLEVVDSVEKVRQKMSEIKDRELTPFQSMQNNVRSLQIANQLLVNSGNDTKLWKQALDRVGDSAARVALHWQIVETAINKATSATSAFNSTTVKVAQALQNQGKLTDARKEYDDALKSAERLKALAANPDQQVKALQEQEKILASLKQSGIDFGFNIDEKNLAVLREQQKIEREIAEKYTKQAEDAKGFLGTSADALLTSRNIQKAIETWPSHIEQAANAINGKGGLNDGLRETKSLVESVVSGLIQLSGGNGGGAFNPRQIEKFLRDEARRGPIPEPTF